MKQHSILSILFLLCLCLLSGSGFAQKYVISRPATKPKTEQKAKPKKQQTAPKKPTTQRGDNGLSEAERLQRAEEAERKRVIDNLVSNMVRVEGGTFMMGANPEQDGEASDDEQPAHAVTLSDFRIGRFEVTAREWRAVMGSAPTPSMVGNLPVAFVSWSECQEFISRLNQLTGLSFRLPTEAEWEYAARGGNRSKGYKYAGSNNIHDVAWYGVNSDFAAHPVGLKRPNELGLYDMSGNVAEWCQDVYGPYGAAAQSNPAGAPASSDAHYVYRGGGWDTYTERDCCVTNRNAWTSYFRSKDLGFRLAL